jgi:rod shape-determining protein MreD
MMRQRSFGSGGAALSLFLALIVAIMPLPEFAAVWRPDAPILILLYWALAPEQRFGLFTAFWVGLALDALTGALLGQHALAMLVVVYLAQRFHLRIRVFPLSQLTLTVAVLLALYEFLLFWIDGVAGRTVPMIERWGPVLSGVMLWPLLVMYLGRTRHDAAVRM